jgi:hypothetical protein
VKAGTRFAKQSHKITFSVTGHFGAQMDCPGLTSDDEFRQAIELRVPAEQIPQTLFRGNPLERRIEPQPLAI